MKPRLLKISLFLAIVILADQISGSVLRRLYNHSNDFAILKLRYSIDSTREDILIFGSSRAEYHFVPSFMSKATHLSVYNCGFAGGNLLFSRIQLNESLKRYKPKYVVIEASPSSFFIPNPDEALKLLMPFYDRDTLIYNTLTRKDPLNEIKFVSSIFPYNSKIAAMVRGVFRDNIDSMNGFKATYGAIDTSGITDQVNLAFATASLDAGKLSYLRDLIEPCVRGNIQVLVVCAPVYQANANHDKMVEQIRTFCGGYQNVHFFDYTRSEKTYHQIAIFRDNSHLNYEGARLFSEIFAKDIKLIVSADMASGSRPHNSQ
jgi:hypothetical protein